MREGQTKLKRDAKEFNITLLLSCSPVDDRHKFPVPGHDDPAFLAEWLVPRKDLYKNEFLKKNLCEL